MKEKVRISSLVTNTILYGKALIDGQWQILTEDFQQLSLHDFETNKDHQGKKMWTFNFSEAAKSFDYEYDTKDKPLLPKPAKDSMPEKEYHDRLAEINAYNIRMEEQNLLNRRKRLATTNFFARHNAIQHKTNFDNGHHVTSHPIAEIEIVTQVARMNYLSDLKVAKAFVKVSQMPWREQYDAAIYYAPEVFGKRQSEVLYRFIGLKGRGTKEAFMGGVLWQGNNLHDFLHNYDQNPTVVMKVYISKAIESKILQRTKDGIYMNQSTYVGRTIDEAVVYFSGDLQSYTNFIQPQVDKLCGLPEEDLVEEVIVPEVSDYEKRELQKAKSEDWKAERKRQIEEATLLGVTDPAAFGQSDLQKLIDAAKAKKKAIERHEATPTAQLSRQIDDLDTLDIEILQSIAASEGVPGWQLYKDVDKLRAKIRSRRESLDTIKEA